jgi:hypothetical protein
MKLRGMLYLVAAVALSQVAQAQAPVSAQALGAAQGVLDFCSRVDPEDERAFDKQSKSLFKGMTERSIDQAQKSDAYKNGYQTLKSVLSELPLTNIRAACKDIR